MRKHFIALFIFAASAIYLTYPLITNFTGLVTARGDELVGVWIQTWVLHALKTNPFHLFEADIYYPFHNSLAYSDLLFTSSLLSAIPLWLLKEPVVAVNFTLISSLFFLGFFTYLLVFFVTDNFLAAVLSGVLVIFSPATLDKHMHMQILAIEGVPLSIVFFIKFLKSAKTRYLLTSLFFFFLQIYNSFLPGYFIVFSYVFLSFFFVRFHPGRWKQLLTKRNTTLVLLSFLIIIPITLPYFAVSKEFHYTRDIRDTIHFALQPEDLLWGVITTRLEPLLVTIFPPRNYPANAEIKPGYLGFVFSLLSLLVLFYWRKKDIQERWIFLSCLAIALTGFILSFGPALHINRHTIHKPFPIILPYALFYYLVPGFQGYRNSARWEMLFVLFIVVCIALLLATILKKYKPSTQTVMYLLLIAGVVAEYNFPMKFVTIPPLKAFPKEYMWFATTPQNTKIIEMPVFNWSMQPYSYGEIMRGYYNASYFRTTVSGFTGFSPPPWQALVTNLLADFPDTQSIQKLHQLGINYILVHTDEYDLLNKEHFKVKERDKYIPDSASILKKLEENKAVKLKKIFPKTYIFQVL